jgi:hypothetical protein
MKNLLILFFIITLLGCASTSTEQPPCLLKLEPLPLFTQKGIFKKLRHESIGKVHLIYPDNIPKGCAVPLVFNNGTFMKCKTYAPYLEYMASHGFLTACYESGYTGSGKQCIEAMDTVLEHPLAATSRIAITGHSQGGGAAHTCHELAERIHTDKQISSFGIQPAHGLLNLDYREDYSKIKSDVAMISGSEDWLVPNSWVQRGYEAIRSPKRWYEIRGITHTSWYDHPEKYIVPTSLSWFRWQLLADDISRDYFNNLPDTDRYKDMGSPLNQLYLRLKPSKTTEKEDILLLDTEMLK